MPNRTVAPSTCTCPICADQHEPQHAADWESLAEVLACRCPGCGWNHRPLGFERAFGDAFDRLRRTRPLNLVELSALRNALPGWTRAAFDAGLFELRRRNLYTLSTFDGRHGRLSDEERAAAIVEGGRTYHYAMKREQW